MFGGFSGGLTATRCREQRQEVTGGEKRRRKIIVPRLTRALTHRHVHAFIIRAHPPSGLLFFFKERLLSKSSCFSPLLSDSVLSENPRYSPFKDVLLNIEHLSVPRRNTISSFSI